MVIRTIMSSKIRDYTILRSIGFEKKRIKQIIKFEIIFIYLVSYLIDLVIFVLLASFSPKTFSNAIKGIGANDIMLLTIIYLFISLLTSRKFNKMLDKKSLLNNLKVE
jgi:ABC-type antimicrobial peptide transport system permease subunit